MPVGSDEPGEPNDAPSPELSARDRRSLQDMLDAARRVELTTGGGREMFLDVEEMHVVAMWYFVVLGEAARRVSDEGRRAVPGLPWRQLIGMRNVLVHRYDDANLPVVWKTATVDLPVLTRALRIALGESVE